MNTASNNTIYKYVSEVLVPILTLLVPILTLLGFELYCFSIVISTSDIQLLIPESNNVLIPILRVEISLFCFYGIVPATICFLHSLFKDHIKKVTQISEEQIPIVKYVPYYFPMFLLFLFQLKFSPYHSVPMTLWHCLLIFLFYKYNWTDTLKSSFKKVKIINPFFLAIAGVSIGNLLIICFLPLIIKYNLDYVPVQIIPKLVIKDKELVSEKPSDLVKLAMLENDKYKKDALLEHYKGLNLEHRDLRFADFSESILFNAKLTGALLGKACLKGTQFDGADLQKANLEGANLVDACLIDAKLQGADMKYAQIDGADLTRAKLDGVDLSYAHAISKQVIFFGASLQKANLKNINCLNAEFGYAKLEEALLTDAILQNSRLRNTILKKADLREADLRGSDLTDAKLQNAYLGGVSLQKAKLISVNLEKADLYYANLESADLRGANLKEAKLWYTKLAHASFKRAKLQNADMSSAQFDNTNLFKAKMQGVNLRNAYMHDEDLSGINMGGADLYNCELQGAYLVGIDLQGANLMNAQLKSTNLKDANLKGVILKDAIFGRLDESSLKYIKSQETWGNYYFRDITNKKQTNEESTALQLFIKVRNEIACHNDKYVIRGIINHFKNTEVIESFQNELPSIRTEKLIEDLRDHLCGNCTDLEKQIDWSL